MSFTSLEITIIALIFTWIGFVRTGLGFGGAVIGLPILMLVGGSPIDWLPIIGIHLLFFSSLTLFKSINSNYTVYFNVRIKKRLGYPY